MSAARKNERTYFYKEFEDEAESGSFSKPNQLVLLSSIGEDFYNKQFVSKMSLFISFMMILLGGMGAVDPNFPLFHFSPIINSLHAALGFLGIFSMFFLSRKAAIGANLTFGGLLLILGVCGFVFGGFDLPTAESSDNFLWSIFQSNLILGTKDHILHVLAGVLLLRSGLNNIKF